MIPTSQNFRQKLKFRTELLKNFITFRAHPNLTRLHKKLQNTYPLKHVEQTNINLVKRLIAELISSQKNNKLVKGISLDSILYALLLLFVELKPINEECTVYWCPIDERRKIYLSNGYQFDIEVLIEYIIKRKNYIDMYTNDSLCHRDIALILSFPVTNISQLIPFIPNKIGGEMIEKFQLELATLLEAENEHLKFLQWQASKESPTTSPLVEMNSFIVTTCDENNIEIIELSDSDDSSICNKLCIIS